MAKAMTVNRLLWELVKHVMHRRGNDEVFLAISWAGDFPDGFATGPVVDFTWAGDQDAFCTIEAEAEDLPMFHEPAALALAMEARDG
jgi:hypothetical protein